jgi:hypothetical protein
MVLFPVQFLGHLLDSNLKKACMNGSQISLGKLVECNKIKVRAPPSKSESCSSHSASQYRLAVMKNGWSELGGIVYELICISVWELVAQSHHD